MAHLSFELELGTPFRPFDQLLGVLPALSKQHVPECLQTLMVDAGSPIIHFYPEKFEIDLNGKKSDWEAVVKIPFIDEKKLLSAIESRIGLLSNEERERNKQGKAFIFTAGATPFHYISPLPSKFPDITKCRTNMVEYELPKEGPIKDTNRLLQNVLLGSKLLPGFCSLDTIPHTATLGYHGVQVFGPESK